MTMDIERGTTRRWYLDGNGVKRWADTNKPVLVDGMPDAMALRSLLEDADEALRGLGVCHDTDCNDLNCPRVRQRIADALSRDW